ncbi:MAG: glycine zipper 2TM domain-containing protein [Gammaproteobacteria bacterium]|nr:glycine zipper 2TM domain-containing protein [Gammaproteobacteria bacterium]
MMKKITPAISLLVITILLSSCATTREEAGALTGAVVGAAVGSNIGKGTGRLLAVWLGAVVGAQVGSTIGKYMDAQDRLKTSEVLEYNKTKASSSWRNPDTGNRYTVTPIQTYEKTSGPCREFTIDALIGGRTQQVYSTACRQQDGSWKVIK